MSSSQSSGSDVASLRPDGFDLQGHRGARGLAPENTLPAFRRALEVGVTTLEMDVVLSRDGEVVVSHEPWMSHVVCSLPSGRPVPAGAEQDHNLYEMTYAEIASYDCGVRRHPDFPRQKTEPTKKPRLTDVTTLAEAYVAEHERASIFYNVEVKARPEWDGRFHPPPGPFVERVLEVISQAGVAARTTLQSFDVRVLRAARTQGRTRGDHSRPRLALLAGVFEPHTVKEHLDILGFMPSVYSPSFHLIDEARVRAVRAHGLELIPWTVNDRADIRRMVHLGVDGIITDVPDVALEVLTALEVQVA